MEPHPHDLAEFGREYRTLFVIGEYDFLCVWSLILQWHFIIITTFRQHPDAQRFEKRTRVLLTDFVSHFGKIRKVADSATTEFQRLQKIARDELHLCDNDLAMQHLTKTIKEGLEMAFNQLRVKGAGEIRNVALTAIDVSRAF
jgi:hypothetical protein